MRMLFICWRLMKELTYGASTRLVLQGHLSHGFSPRRDRPESSSMC